MTRFAVDPAVHTAACGVHQQGIAVECIAILRVRRIMAIRTLRLLHPWLTSVLDRSHELCHAAVTILAGLARTGHNTSQALGLGSRMTVITAGSGVRGLGGSAHLVLVEVMHCLG